MSLISSLRLYGFIGFFSLCALTLVQGQAVPPLRYGFETGTEGWQKTTFASSQAITNLAQSAVVHQSGSFALRLDLNLQGSTTANASGEVSVDMLSYPPYGVPIPV